MYAPKSENILQIIEEAKTVNQVFESKDWKLTYIKFRKIFILSVKTFLKTVNQSGHIWNTFCNLSYYGIDLHWT